MELRHDTLDGVKIVAVTDKNKLHTLYTAPEKDVAWAGDIYTAQIRRYAPAQRAYFMDIGNGNEAFLPQRDPKLFAEGAKIAVKIERPATKDKHARVSLVADKADGAIGAVKKGLDILAQAQRDFPEAKTATQGLQDFDAEILSLVNPVFEMPDGIQLVFEEITALTAVDINSADPGLGPMEVNRRAAAEIARQLRLRNLNKQILIDFLRIRDQDQRRDLQDEFWDLLGDDPREVKLFGFTRLGLCELTRTRLGLSLSDVFGMAKAA